MSKIGPTALSFISECQKKGTSLRQIATLLDDSGIDPPGAKRKYRDGRKPQWSAVAVKRIGDRDGLKPLCTRCQCRDMQIKALTKRLSESINQNAELHQALKNAQETQA